MAIGIRKIAELKRHQSLLPHQRRAKPRSKSQKEHAPPAVTAERLHGRIVDQAHRSTEGPVEIKSDPSFAQMLWIFCDASLAHRRRETDSRRLEFPPPHA